MPYYQRYSRYGYRYPNSSSYVAKTPHTKKSLEHTTYQNKKNHTPLNEISNQKSSRGFS